MTKPYLHGPRMDMSVDNAITVTPVKTSPVGVVITAPDADDSFLPLNTATQMPDFSAETLAKIGDTGTGKAVMAGLTAQGIAPTTTVVRVAEDADETTQAANVDAGIDVLKNAAVMAGTPIKLLGIPGLETNALSTKLAGVAETLGGFSYSAIPGCDTYQQAITARAGYGHKNMMLLWPGAVSNGTREIPLAALALGFRVAVDNTSAYGIKKTISNLPVSGVESMLQQINYKGVDSVANQLNAHEITTLIKKDGWRFWGNRTPSNEPLYAFETDVRISHYVEALIQQLIDANLDHLTDGDAIADVVEQGQILLDGLARGDDAIIIDGEFFIDPNLNSEQVLAAGGVEFSYRFGTAKPMEQPGFNGRITNQYLAQVLPDIAPAASTQL